MFEKTRVQQSRCAKRPNSGRDSIPLNITNKPSVKPVPIAAPVQLTDPWDLIKTHENDQNEDLIKCDICLEDDDAEGDEIVICELCFAAAHQSCYGGDIKTSLPPKDKPWYCARCQHLLKNEKSKPTDIQCHFCCDLKGIMKPIKNQKWWAHLICVNWTPEIWFNEDGESVGGQVNVKRFGLHCGKCRSNKGSCVQCDFLNCHRSWHVRCAVSLGLIKPWEEMQAELGNPVDDSLTPIFCKEHQA